MHDQRRLTRRRPRNRPQGPTPMSSASPACRFWWCLVCIWWGLWFLAGLRGWLSLYNYILARARAPKPYANLYGKNKTITNKEGKEKTIFTYPLEALMVAARSTGVPVCISVSCIEYSRWRSAELHTTGCMSRSYLGAPGRRLRQIGYT